MVTHEISFPVQEAPPWASQVERWYQLDGPAFALTQTYYEKLREQPLPGLIILVDLQASNVTDSQFAKTGALRPQKFVHTLPNVRGSSLLQVIGESIPILSVQGGPYGAEKARAIAQLYSKQERQKAWVFQVEDFGPPWGQNYGISVWMGDDSEAANPYK